MMFISIRIYFYKSIIYLFIYLSIYFFFLLAMPWSLLLRGAFFQACPLAKQSSLWLSFKPHWCHLSFWPSFRPVQLVLSPFQRSLMSFSFSCSSVSSSSCLGFSFSAGSSLTSAPVSSSVFSASLSLFFSFLSFGGGFSSEEDWV